MRSFTNLPIYSTPFRRRRKWIPSTTLWSQSSTTTIWSKVPWRKCNARKRADFADVYSSSSNWPSSGNLSVRSLADVVSADDFIQTSEYLETLLIAVPRWNRSCQRRGLTKLVNDQDTGQGLELKIWKIVSNGRAPYINVRKLVLDLFV